MFEQVSATLDQAIDELDIPVDAAALTRCFALLDRLTAKITMAVRDFDEAGAWKDSGATSMTAWLRHQARRSHRGAASCARTARRLGELPVTAQAYGEGVLSGGQVQAIVANLNDRTAPLFGNAEADLVPILSELPVRDVSTTMQRWAQAAKDSLDEPEPVIPERSLHLSKTLHGRRELTGSFDPEAGALAETALRLAQTPDTEAEAERTPAHRRADALVDIFRFFLDHQRNHLGGRHRPHLNVFLDYDDLGHSGGRGNGRSNDDAIHATATGPLSDLGEPTSTGHAVADDGHTEQADGGHSHTGQSCGGRGVLSHTNGGKGQTRSAWLPDGTVLDTTTIDRLACDCAIHRIVHQGRSSILDYGTSARTVPANLWAALVARDQHCRFPGCDRPPEWCEGHHVPAWEDGGPTSISTTVLGCSRHHHLVHMPGWHNKLLPDGTYEVTNPQGQTFTTYPPGRPPDLFEPRPPT